MQKWLRYFADPVGGGVVLECSDQMTNQERKSCKLPCETNGRDWRESLYNFGAVAYNYMDPRIVHMGKEGVKAGLVRLPRKQSFSIYRGKVVLVIPLSTFCTETNQVGSIRAGFKPFQLFKPWLLFPSMFWGEKVSKNYIERFP